MTNPKKVSNGLRIACIVIYIIQVFLLTEDYTYLTDNGSNPTAVSCFSLIYKSFSQGEVSSAIYSVIMALIPILGFFVFCFDKKRNIKAIYAVITSIVAVFLIISTINLYYMGFGAMITMLLYIPLVFLAVIGMFAKNQ